MADLDAIVRHSGVKEEDLLRECPREIRIKIALKLTDWKVFGHILGLSKEKLSSIERDNKSEDERKIALLDSWYEKESRNATSLKLAKGLRDHDRGDLITHLCELTIIESKSDQGWSVTEKVEAAGISKHILYNTDVI